MPYIKQERRKALNEFCESIAAELKEPGELNYVISYILLLLLKKQGMRYKNICTAIGELEAAKLEFYRKIVSPYEESKISENGEVGE